MTLPNWGNVTPSQMFMLALAGQVLSRGFVEPGTEFSDEERLHSMRWGKHELQDLTGEDFGYDLECWHLFLLESGFGYKHPYAWKNVKPAIENAVNDPDRRRLVALLASAERTRIIDQDISKKTG